MNHLKVIFLSKNKSLQNWCFQVLEGNMECCIRPYWSFADFIFADGSILEDKEPENLKYLLEVFSSLPVIFFYSKSLDNSNHVFSDSGRRISIVEAFTSEGELQLKAVCSGMRKRSAEKVLTVESYEADEKSSGDLLTEITENGGKAHISPLMQEFYGKISNACSCDETVLLSGERGSGKSFYARYIHDHSERKNGPFQRQNVAELSPGIIESQLFGTETGAYTGAVKSTGIIRAADGGTLFLDEIGELVLNLQPKLLSVIEYYQVRPLGSNNYIHVDVRMIFATNRNLKKMVEQGTFRSELYDRMNVLEIEVPPLRKHKEDIPYLARTFASRYNCLLTENAVKKLQDYDWPGNIRQLDKEITKACSRRRNSTVDETVILK